MKFEDYRFTKEIHQNIAKLGYKRPTDIQFKSIPSILNEEDVLAIAQTGTGKTAAFAIPVLDKLFRKKRNQRRPDGIKCIVLEPTHELAQQVTDVIKSIARGTKVNVLGIYGGVDQTPQIEALEKRVDIIVATPGRMFDLIAQQHLRVDRTEILIIDEADHMLKLGFLSDIQDLIKKLPKRRQTLFFSATIDSKIKSLAYKLVNQNAVRIQISPKNPVSKNVDHRLVFVDMDDKRFFLERLIQEHPENRMIVFVRTKVRAERVHAAMERVGIETVTIHSDKNQEERTKTLEHFKNNQSSILIATDVTARGIDIPNIDIVVNYDLPEVAENYVHRVGRTGRGGNRGEALSFCSENEKELLKAIEEYTGQTIQVEEITKSDLEDTKLLTSAKTLELKDMMKELEKLEKNRKKRK